MTTKEDELFYEIIEAARDMPENIAAEHQLEAFARIYKEKVETKEIKANKYVFDIVRQIIPEDFL